jgi:hypothetical protein
MGSQRIYIGGSLMPAKKTQRPDWRTCSLYAAKSMSYGRAPVLATHARRVKYSEPLSLVVMSKNFELTWITPRTVRRRSTSQRL